MLAQEVMEMVKEVCGKEAFSKAYAMVHQGVTATRDRRRKAQALQVGVVRERENKNSIIIANHMY